MNAVQMGKAEAAITDAISARLYIQTHVGLIISPLYVTSDPYAVAVRNNSLFLADAINAAVDSMRRDGTLDAIINRWLPTKTTLALGAFDQQ
jgi:polar amino acid transport system substrate-binding protein